MTPARRSDTDAAAFSNAANSTFEEDEQQELLRLKANAVAAWLVNTMLVIWIVWLYQRRVGMGPSPAPEDRKAITSLLRQQLEEERATLDADKKLKEELRQEEKKMADIAKRLEDRSEPTQDTPLQQLQQLVNDLRQQVLREETLLADRDEQLVRSFQVTSRDLGDARNQPEAPLVLVDDKVLGPVTSTASGLLAGLDISIAAEAMLLAVLLSTGKSWLPSWRAGGGTQDLKSPPGQAGAGGPGSLETEGAGEGGAESSLSADEEERLRSEVVLRFYGRWDDQPEWVLLRSLPLEGAAASVVSAVRRSKSLIGTGSDWILTALVTRSARGLVQRRGWSHIVEQTMDEVGRNFFLGYLVETAADKVEPRIPVVSEEKQVLEVPSASILDNPR